VSLWQNDNWKGIRVKNIIACNLGSYRQFRETAYEHLPSIGVMNVEIGVPAPDQVDAVQAKLAAHGLTATSLMAACPIGEEDVVEKVKPAIDVAAQMGVKVIFISVHAGETPREVVFDRLRAIGDYAAPHGIKMALETHPDLCHNGDVAAETMAAIHHPNLGINFDTGNVYHYNHNVTAVGEVAKIASHVVSVHLKDTLGGYRAWDFPTLGRGVVDFAGVFQILNGVGFTGPFTLELEGMEGENLSLEETQTRVRESVEHLRSLGLIE